MGNHRSKEAKQEINHNGSQKLPTHHLPFQRKKKKLFSTIKRIKSLFNKNSKKKKTVQIHNNKPFAHSTFGSHAGFKTGNFTSYCSPYLLIQDNSYDDPLANYWPPLQHSRLPLINRNDSDQFSKNNVLEEDPTEDGIVKSRKSSLIDETNNVAIRKIYSSVNVHAKEIKLDKKPIPKLSNRSRSNSSNGTGELLTCSSGSNDEFEDACSSLTDDIIMKSDTSAGPILEIICEEQLSQNSTLDVKTCYEISKTLISDSTESFDLNMVKKVISNQEPMNLKLQVNAIEEINFNEKLSNLHKTEIFEEGVDDFQIIKSIEDNDLNEARRSFNANSTNLLLMSQEEIFDNAKNVSVLAQISECNHLDTYINDETNLKDVKKQSSEQLFDNFPVLVEKNEKLQQSVESSHSEKSENFENKQRVFTCEQSRLLSNNLQIKSFFKENEIVMESIVSEAPKAIEESIDDEPIVNEPPFNHLESNIKLIDEPESIIQSEKLIINDASRDRFISLMDKESSPIDLNKRIPKFNEETNYEVLNNIFKQSIEDFNDYVKMKKESSLGFTSSVNDIGQNILDFSEIKSDLETKQNSSFSEDLESKLLTEDLTEIIVESSFNFSPEEKTSSDGSQSSVMEIDDDVWEEEDQKDLNETPAQAAIEIKSKLVLDLLVQAEVDMEDFSAFIKLPCPLEEKYHLLQIQRFFDVHNIINKNLDELSRSFRMISKFGLDLLKPIEERPPHWKKILHPLETPSCSLLSVQDIQNILLEFGYKRFESGVVFLEEEEVDAEAIAAWVVELLLAAHELNSFSRQTHPQQQLLKNIFINEDHLPLDTDTYTRVKKPQLIKLQPYDSLITKKAEEPQVDAMEQKSRSQNVLSFHQDSVSEVLPTFSAVSAQRCHLCVSFTPSVQCKECSNLIFCSSCDDLYHRHPKRRNHVRQLMERSKSPSLRSHSNLSLNPTSTRRQRKSPTPDLPVYEQCTMSQQLPMDCSDFNHQDIKPSINEQNKQWDDCSYSDLGKENTCRNSANSPIYVDNWSFQTHQRSPKFESKSYTPTSITMLDHHQLPVSDISSLNFCSRSEASNAVGRYMTRDSPSLNHFQNTGLHSVSVMDFSHYYDMCTSKPQACSMLKEIDVANAILSCGCQFGLNEFGWWQPFMLCPMHRFQTVYLPISSDQFEKCRIYQNNTPLATSPKLTAPTISINTVNDDVPTQSVKKRIKGNKNQKSKKSQSNANEVESVSNGQEIKDTKQVRQNYSDYHERQIEADKIELKNKMTVVNDGIIKECEHSPCNENCDWAICGIIKNNADELDLQLSIDQNITIQSNGENRQHDLSKELDSLNIDLELLKIKPSINFKINETKQELQLTEDENIKIQSHNLEDQQQIISKTFGDELISVEASHKDIKTSEQALETKSKVRTPGIAKSDKWECEHCTYFNDKINIICAVCCKTKISGSSFSPIGKNAVQTAVPQTICNQTENESKIICNQSEHLQVEDRLKDENLIIKQNPENIANTVKSTKNINSKVIVSLICKSEEWECEYCTVTNDKNNTICSVCCKSRMPCLERDNCELTPHVLQKISAGNQCRNILKERQNINFNDLTAKEEKSKEGIATRSNSLTYLLISKKVNEDEWECKHCSFINSNNNIKVCNVCCKTNGVCVSSETLENNDPDISQLPQEINIQSEDSLEMKNEVCQIKKLDLFEIDKKIITLKESSVCCQQEPYQTIEPEITIVDAVEKWECEHCTFINNKNSKICAVCCKTKLIAVVAEDNDDLPTSSQTNIAQFEKELGSCQIQQHQNHVKSLSSFSNNNEVQLITNQTFKNDQLVEIPIINLKPEVEDSLMSDPEKWECDYCTFINNKHNKICDVCCKTKTLPINSDQSDDIDEPSSNYP